MENSASPYSRLWRKNREQAHLINDVTYITVDDVNYMAGYLLVLVLKKEKIDPH